MQLTRDTWHGFTRKAGEIVTPDKRGRDSIVTDGHGCGNQWVRDSAGQLMNVWDCEVTK
jgi:hypothetical protein